MSTLLAAVRGAGLALLLGMVCGCAAANNTAAAAYSSDIAAAAFARHGVQGTLVVMSDRRGDLLVHDAERAARPYPAASTFKIPNTHIALELGVASGPDQGIAWDGVTRDLSVWNQDQTLTSAFQVSCVWCYQRFARAIGAPAYRDWLQRLDYGALADDFVVDSFWLDGSLRISARQQIDFLQRLHDGRVPLSAATLAAGRQVMRIEAADGGVRYAKTGWFTRTDPGVGWYVGWTEGRFQGEAEVVYFALNIDTTSAAELPARVAVVDDVLAALR